MYALMSFTGFYTKDEPILYLLGKVMLVKSNCCLMNQLTGEMTPYTSLYLQCLTYQSNDFKNLPTFF